MTPFCVTASSSSSGHSVWNGNHQQHQQQQQQHHDSGAHGADYPTVDEIMLSMIEYREEADEARRVDEARLQSEQSRKREARQRRAQLQAELDERLRCATVVEWATRSDMFAQSWLLQTAGVTPIPNSDVVVAAVQDHVIIGLGKVWQDCIEQNDNIREQFVMLLSLEKQAQKWYHNVLPRCYFVKHVATRLAHATRTRRNAAAATTTSTRIPSLQVEDSTTTATTIMASTATLSARMDNKYGDNKTKKNSDIPASGSTPSPPPVAPPLQTNESQSHVDSINIATASVAAPEDEGVVQQQLLHQLLIEVSALQTVMFCLSEQRGLVPRIFIDAHDQDQRERQQQQQQQLQQQQQQQPAFAKDSNVTRTLSEVNHFGDDNNNHDNDDNDELVVVMVEALSSSSSSSSSSWSSLSLLSSPPPIPPPLYYSPSATTTPTDKKHKLMMLGGDDDDDDANNNNKKQNHRTTTTNAAAMSPEIIEIL